VADSDVVIAHVRPSLLGTYGDGGNALVLQQRLRRRGIAAEVLTLDGSEPVPRSSGVVVIGGGEDDAQTVVAHDVALRDSLRGAIDAGASVLAVCAGFQILGSRFDGSDGAVTGFDIIDGFSDRLPQRAVGEIVTRADVERLGVLTGFENHQGRTVLGPDAAPLGRVVVGVGNGHESVDGAVAGGVYATYLHGPVLARNPALADALLARVVGPLQPLPFDDVDVLRSERLHAALTTAPRRRRWLRSG
jgi:CobQ-like glutamine amidotransferase family enzyme